MDAPRIASELKPGAAPTLKMHLIGSRAFGRLHPESDWDAIYQDSPETRMWLRAAGFINLPRPYGDPLRENMSYWRHNTYTCECFLVRSETRRLAARWIIEHSHVFAVVKQKHFRKRIWWSLERCLIEIAQIIDEHAAWRAARLSEPCRRRPIPLLEVLKRQSQPSPIANKPAPCASAASTSAQDTAGAATG